MLVEEWVERTPPLPPVSVLEHWGKKNREIRAVFKHFYIGDGLFKLILTTCSIWCQASVVGVSGTAEGLSSNTSTLSVTAVLS